MKYQLRLLLCALLLLTQFSLGFAQKNRWCPVPPPSPFKHSGKIFTAFDRAGGGMRTTLEHPRNLGKAPDALYLSASFIHQDPRRGIAPTVDVMLVSTSSVAKYSQMHDLVFTCDGRPIPLKAAARYQSKRDESGMVYEATRVTLSVEQLAMLIGAKKVSARLGATEVELTNNHLEALRELASLVSPSASRWRAEE